MDHTDKKTVQKNVVTHEIIKKSSLSLSVKGGKMQKIFFKHELIL